jgi:MFS family permease
LGRATTWDRGSVSTTPPSRALVPVLLFVGTVVAVISSLGAPLVPAIAATMATTLPNAQWALTVTLLVGAIATPVIGRLGDGPRRREVVLAVLAVVALGGVPDGWATVPGGVRSSSPSWAWSRSAACWPLSPSTWDG